MRQLLYAVTVTKANQPMSAHMVCSDHRDGFCREQVSDAHVNFAPFTGPMHRMLRCEVCAKQEGERPQLARRIDDRPRRRSFLRRLFR